MKLSKYISFIASMLFAASSAHAAVEISASPLQTGGDVPPNIMFIMDDSGSMAWEYMPDSISGYYVAGTTYYCSNWDWWGSCTSGAGWQYDGAKANYRWYYSAKVNGVYFDPDVKYEVPFKADGVTSWGVPTFTKVWDDGFDKDDDYNLTNNFVHRGMRFYNGAFYYQYDESLAGCRGTNKQYNNDCYKYIGHEDMTSDMKQKFAIWYTYYRTRLLASKSAISLAFKEQSAKLRVGYGSINKTNNYEGVAPFTGKAKKDFFKWLFDVEASGSTPLRYALDAAGQYYKKDEPWRTDPSDSSSEMLSCRPSYSILMTDGYWNDAAANTSGARQNNDNEDGPAYTNDQGIEVKYEARSPFKDSYSNTLADVAMYYWKNDLKLNIANNVPTKEMNPAFWQHMRVWGISLGLEGKVPAKKAFDAITKKDADAITWPEATADSAATIDDLLHAAVNSRGGFFSAKNPTELRKDLSKTLEEMDKGSASASNAAGTTTATHANQYVFQGSYDSKDWTGSLASYDIDNPTTKVWTANFPVWDVRNLLFNGAAGVKEFKWSNLTSSEKSVLKSENLVNYLRGEQVNEASGDNFRSRRTVLGDIANSSPLFVAESVNRNYGRHNWAGASSYSDFVADNKNRDGRIYVGANDGFLHAFDAATGTETFAYMPKAMLKESTDLASYADPDYAHKYFVDGSPVVADVYTGSSWKSILVGSLGRGGNSLFAIDVTDPNSMTADKVLWDKSYDELGVITTRPVITRLNNGSWAVVVGYGYNNTTKGSGLLVIDIEDGSVLAAIEAPDTVDANAHGLGQVEGWDANRDGITDWFFSGDLLGNVWKFDLSSNSPTTWDVAYAGFPLFRAKNDMGEPQPITGGLTLSSEPSTGQLWVFFGTGKMLTASDVNNEQVQSWYGIKDVVGITDRSKLKKREMQNVTYTDPAGVSRIVRTVSEATENDMADKLGWYMDLIDSKERIVTQPVRAGKGLVVSTAIPSGNDCKPAGEGYMMSIDPFKGARLKYHFFDLSKDGKYTDADGKDGKPVSGIKVTEGSPSQPVVYEDKIATGLTNTDVAVESYNGGLRRGRVSWRELTN